MQIARYSGQAFIGALFGIVFIWGFWPDAWTLGWPSLALLALALVSAVLWVVFSLDALRIWLKKRSTQFAISLFVTAVGAVAILATVNYLAEIYNVKKDVTKNKLHTLSEQTVKIAGELKEDIVLTVWSTKVDQMSANLDMRKFLENYQIAGKGKIKVDIKNPNQAHLEASKANIKKDNVIVVRSSVGREVRVEAFNDSKGEEQITNAIVQSIKGRKKTVCFLSGHGERGLEDAQAEGLSLVKTRLTDSSYETKELTLVSQDKVPEDCEMVVIVGPQGDAAGREIEVLAAYLRGGGKVLGLFGPGTTASWRKLTEPYGIEVRHDLVFEPSVKTNQSGAAGALFVATNNYAKDVEVVKAFNRLVVLPETSSIQVPTQSKDGKSNIRTFVSTWPTAYAKSGDTRSIRDSRRAPGDLGGPLALGVLITRPVEAAVATPVKKALPPLKKEAPAEPKATQGFFSWLEKSAVAQEGAPELPPGLGDLGAAASAEKKDVNETSLIVYGNSAFVANSFVTQVGNLDLFLNSVSYLLKDNDLIGIRPREIRQASLELSFDRLRKVYATILLVAGLFLVMGIRAGRRRSAA